MHYLRKGLALNATEEQLRQIQFELSPSAMRNGDNGTYRVMNKNSDNQKVKSAGATNYRDTLAGYDELLDFLDALYESMEQLFPSPCHQARLAYWRYRQRARQHQNGKK